jgi:hypothetical protein
VIGFRSGFRIGFAERCATGIVLPLFRLDVRLASLQELVEPLPGVILFRVLTFNLVVVWTSHRTTPLTQNGKQPRLQARISPIVDDDD